MSLWALSLDIMSEHNVMVSSVPATRKHKLVMLSIVIFYCAMSEADLNGVLTLLVYKRGLVL